MKTRTAGFTLVELLVVISIISLLSSIVLSALNSARLKAREAYRAESAKSIKNALELYYDANGRYPYNLQGGPTAYLLSNLASDLSPYLSAIPTDPQGQIWNYAAQESGTNQDYMLRIYSEISRPGWGNQCRTSSAVADIAAYWAWGGMAACPY